LVQQANRPFSGWQTIAFGSGASNLTAFSPPYPRPQIYAQTRDSHGRLRTKLLATGGGAWLRGMSSDGRFVAVATVAGYSIVDRLIGSLATVVRLEEVGKDPYINPIKAALSGDGRLLAFDAPRAAVIANDRSDLRDVFVRDVVSMHPVAAGDPADVTKNGMIGDTVLQVVDARTLAVIGTSCPTLDVAVANGKARPARISGQRAHCPVSPNGDLNGDGDANDAVVHFCSAAAIANFGAAISVVLRSLMSRRSSASAARVAPSMSVAPREVRT
jgi:hypothetical protein